jgi:hypothetical protein
MSSSALLTALVMSQGPARRWCVSLAVSVTKERWGRKVPLYVLLPPDYLDAEVLPGVILMMMMRFLEGELFQAIGYARMRPKVFPKGGRRWRELEMRGTLT